MNSIFNNLTSNPQIIVLFTSHKPESHLVKEERPPMPQVGDFCEGPLIFVYQRPKTVLLTKNMTGLVSGYVAARMSDVLI